MSAPLLEVSELTKTFPIVRGAVEEAVSYTHLTLPTTPYV